MFWRGPEKEAMKNVSDIPYLDQEVTKQYFQKPFGK
jgi:hypothetical protein